jgi:hypothetical protein
LLAEFQVHPVGSGYIDIIVSSSEAERFLERLTKIGVAVDCITLWCEATDANKQRHGCPHGMGGPVHNGVWFSEMCERDPFDISDHGIEIADSQLDPRVLVEQCNSLALSYVTTGMKLRPEYSPCLAPGFWLAVPESWRSHDQQHIA